MTLGFMQNGARGTARNLRVNMIVTGRKNEERISRGGSKLW